MNEHTDTATISVDDAWIRELAARVHRRPRAAPRRARRIRRVPPNPSRFRLMAIAPTRTDATLVRRLQARDRTAWEELYAEYQPRLRAFGYRLTGSAHDADDLAQETFVRALPALDRLDPDDGRPERLPLRDDEEPLPQAGRAGEAGRADRGGARARSPDGDRGRPRAKRAPASAAGGGASRQRTPRPAPAARARALRARGPLVRRDRRARRAQRERRGAARLPRARAAPHRAAARAGRPGVATRGMPRIPAAPRAAPRRQAPRPQARDDARAPRGVRALPGGARRHARGEAPLPRAAAAAARHPGRGRARRRRGRSRAGRLLASALRAAGFSSGHAARPGSQRSWARPRLLVGGGLGAATLLVDTPEPAALATTSSIDRIDDADGHDPSGDHDRAGSDRDDDGRRSRSRPPSCRRRPGPERRRRR